MMNNETVVAALNATTDPVTQREATELLHKLSELPGFSPELLRIVHERESTCLTTRVSASIYFKNIVLRSWQPIENSIVPLNEEDKDFIRKHIFDIICCVDENKTKLILVEQQSRKQLILSCATIFRVDFEERLTGLDDKIIEYLNSHSFEAKQGALMILVRLGKMFEYRRLSQTKFSVMIRKLMPFVLREAQNGCFSQPMILDCIKPALKLVYCLIQYHMNLEIFAEASIIDWLQLCTELVRKPEPDELRVYEERETREKHEFWKMKKWASRILERVLDRYGTPGQTDETYSIFAHHFLSAVAPDALNVNMQMVFGRNQGHFVSTRVLYYSLSFINASCSHSSLWKSIKMQAQNLVTHVIHPLLSFTEEDEELWESDPEEFVRIKFDIFEDVINPTYAASGLIKSMVRRKDVLNTVLFYAITKLNKPTSANEVDGALHIIGIINESLVEHKKYKKDIEKLLDAHVFPNMVHQSKHVRARAAWVLSEYNEAPFRDANILLRLGTRAVDLVLNEQEEIPVRVEAAIAINGLIDEQNERIVSQFIRPRIIDIMEKLMKLLVSVQIEEILSVLDAIVNKYTDDVLPITCKMANDLANVFTQIINSEFAEDRSPALMSLTHVMTNLLELIQEHEELIRPVELCVLRICQEIINTSSIDFYEDLNLMVLALTRNYISEEMWVMYHNLVTLHKNMETGIILFSDFAPVLDQYITVDIESFLARPERLDILIDIANDALNMRSNNDENIAAAQLFEIVVLCCGDHIKSSLQTIIHILLQRFDKSFEDRTVLNARLVQALIAVLYINQAEFLRGMSIISNSYPNPYEFLLEQILLHHTQFSGVHGRKTAIIGLLTIYNLPLNDMPPLFVIDPSKAMNVCLSLFEEMQKVVDMKSDMREVAAAKEKLDEFSHDNNKRRTDNALSDDDDEIDMDSLDHLKSIIREHGVDDDDEECSIADSELTAGLELYNSVDVFINFRRTMLEFEKKHSQLSQNMYTNLGERQRAYLPKLIEASEQHEQSFNAKQVNHSGGYVFDTANMPTSFNFNG